MAKHFTDHISLPASLDTIRSLFSDPDYAPTKYHWLGYTSISVLHTRSERDLFESCCQYQLPEMVRLPSSLKRILGSREARTVTHSYGWNWPTLTGWIEIRMKQPKGLEIDCRTSLTASSSQQQSILKLDWHICCHMPFLGTAIEQQAAKSIRQGADQDAKVIQQLLESLPT